MNRVNIEAVYQSFEGWKTIVSEIDNFDAMPDKMKIYINYLNNFLKVPVKYISNGPGREQIVST